jgi:hypothetical protein
MAIHPIADDPILALSSRKKPELKKNRYTDRASPQSDT